ncbi:Rid family hydrolase [Chryseobacterium arthrosphaerae]|uniref:Rid family hydrolase n=1 Tax=Chryseobacterium arthrosphaerae TaxID=651561 RepID=UPI001BAFED35|nr:Rid family hydrolase [Chryseobacterium arthrosphaerae]QUY57400.1 RidA family protein [Chryseobacterium arthrosphaerae]
MVQENKKAEGLGMPWEDIYGYAQAVKKGNTVWISGQLGHNEKGELAEGMEAQMKQTYANIKELLSRYDMTMENVVEEVIYAMDMTTAFEARKKFKTEFYDNPEAVASTMVGVSGLALPGQLVEIKIVATV